jgi:3-oxoacyl-[acyl-carrier protein] reductase
VLRTDLTGVFNCSKTVLRSMIRRRSGRIVTISSVVGLLGNPGQTAYAAAKAGVLGFTRALAREVASRNITVNAVAPGYISTEMTAALPEKAAARLLEQIPLGRLGEGTDVAGAVRFLLSEDAAYVTGQTLSVDGGMYM